MPIVSLLTDFGLDDAFVGEVKGAVLSIAPEAVLVDLTHGVPRGGVREAAWLLARAVPVFPAGTVHLAVVDPGVGGERRPLAARAGGRWFVGPDNGLLLPALEAAVAAAREEGDASDDRPEIREIALRELDRRRRGTTFDGRDVFAPAAARLAGGAELAGFGPEVHDPVPMGPFAPIAREDGWDAEIVRVDRFGNLVTIADEPFLRGRLGDEWRDLRVVVAGRELSGIRLAYAEVPEGEALLAIGGAGTLEIAVNGGDARVALGAAPGDRVRIRPPAAGDA